MHSASPARARRPSEPSGAVSRRAPSSSARRQRLHKRLHQRRSLLLLPLVRALLHELPLCRVCASPKTRTRKTTTTTSSCCRHDTTLPLPLPLPLRHRPRRTKRNSSRTSTSSACNYCATLTTMAIRSTSMPSRSSRPRPFRCSTPRTTLTSSISRTTT